MMMLSPLCAAMGQQMRRSGTANLTRNPHLDHLALLILLRANKKETFCRCLTTLIPLLGPMEEETVCAVPISRPSLYLRHRFWRLGNSRGTISWIRRFDLAVSHLHHRISYQLWREP